MTALDNPYLEQKKIICSTSSQVIVYIEIKNYGIGGGSDEGNNMPLSPPPKLRSQNSLIKQF